jgi:hypothetical protein
VEVAITLMDFITTTIGETFFTLFLFLSIDLFLFDYLEQESIGMQNWLF